MGLLFDYAEVREETFTMLNDYGTVVPTDILLVIDTSGSMDDEIEKVRAFLGDNLLAPLDEIDYQFLLMAADSTITSTCPIPAELISELTADIRNEHFNIVINSTDSYTKIKNNWVANIKSHFRVNSLLNIIVITDDNASMTYPTFKTEMTTLGNGDFILHGIIGLKEEDLLAIPKRIYGIGENYKVGIADTGGVQCDIVTPYSDWSGLFDEISKNIIRNVNGTFFLKEDALSYGFHIYINDVEQIGNWRFNSRNNSITFTGPSFEAGDQVRIVYNTTVSGT